MPVDLTFTERLSSILSMTDAFVASGNDLESARTNAKELEAELVQSASTIAEYQAKLSDALIALQSSQTERVDATESLDQDEVFNQEGPTFGAYRYATYHADGLMSTVYKAEARDENAAVRVVALKVTHPAMMSPPHNSIREARLLRKAHHDHVVPLLETMKQPGDDFVLVFPFLRQDLENLLRSGRLDDMQAAMVFDGLFSALEHIHSLGLIHRDVKPSNILLKSMKGPVYLIDFGIAWSPDDKESEPATVKITDVGTTCYRPPEILFGSKAYDTSLDMWAAGCVVAEMVKVGHLPIFDAGDLGSELALIKSIFTTLGTPNEQIWPSAKTCPDWGKMRFQQFPPKPWKDILSGTSAEALDFISKTICYEMPHRLTAKEALRHELKSSIQTG